MKIVKAEVRLVDLETEEKRSDAVQEFIKQETPMVFLETEDGLTGIGYSYTIGFGGSSVVALIRDHLLPQLIGQDARQTEFLWRKLFSSIRSTAPGAITALALAAIDTAIWDLKAKRQNEPLWIAAGGNKQVNDLYDTESGWLHIPTEDVVSNLIALKAKGWNAAKIKVGLPTVHDDRERLDAVRSAVGDDFEIMVDANQAFSLAEAIRRARAYEDYGIAWFEEPLIAEDVSGHAVLAGSTTIPIAVGETLYSVGQFREYVNHNSASIIQVDVARVGGITPWLKVANLAEANNLDIAPHFLMELHTALVSATPAGRWVEHIPQLTAVTNNPQQIEGDTIRSSDTPGLGIDWNLNALENFTVSGSIAKFS